MKLASFSMDDRATFGVEVEGGVADLSAHGDSLVQFLREGGLERLKKIDLRKLKAIALDRVEFLPLLSHPARVFCAGLNYADKQKEMNERPQGGKPSFFSRFDDSLVAHEASLVRPSASPHFDYEGECAVVIGKEAHHVSSENALSYVAGYTCFNDGTVRDYVPQSVFAGKNFRRSGSIGPWLATADAIPDPAKLVLKTRLNGQEVQSCTLAELIFDVPSLISYLSHITVLMPGDVIATGSPAGVGARRNPPVWLKKGDVVEVEVAGVGLLRNMVVDE